MSGRKPVLMMTNTNRQLNVVGDKIRADSWYAMTDGLHTIQVVYNNLVGGFKVQGTLSDDPKEGDWFDIGITGRKCNNNQMIQYPLDPNNPTGENGGDSGTDAFTFIGNFTYLRAVLDRSYLGDISPDANLGSIDRVLLSL